MNNRYVDKEIEKILSELKFQVSFLWNYDPQGLLSSIRVKCKLPPFIHESKPDVEKYANQREWKENTLIDTTVSEQPTRKIDTTLAMIIFKQLESSNKICRDDGGYTAEKTTKNKFKLIYNKRAKTTTSEKEKVIEIVDTKGPETNNDQQVNNEDVTVIINETLTEIEKEQATAKETDTQMIEK